jgi:predicted RNase H-like nuclease (RuvC/YqgF family)
MKNLLEILMALGGATGVVSLITTVRSMRIPKEAAYTERLTNQNIVLADKDNRIEQLQRQIEAKQMRIRDLDKECQLLKRENERLREILREHGIKNV